MTEFKGIWYEHREIKNHPTFVLLISVLFQNLSGGTEENHENISEVTRSMSRDLGTARMCSISTNHSAMTFDHSRNFYTFVYLKCKIPYEHTIENIFLVFKYSY